LVNLVVFDIDVHAISPLTGVQQTDKVAVRLFFSAGMEVSVRETRPIGIKKIFQNLLGLRLSVHILTMVQYQFDRRIKPLADLFRIPAFKGADKI
jgi:hypothetical protein